MNIKIEQAQYALDDIKRRRDEAADRAARRVVLEWADKVRAAEQALANARAEADDMIGAAR